MGGLLQVTTSAATIVPFKEVDSQNTVSFWYCSIHPDISINHRRSKWLDTYFQILIIPELYPEILGGKPISAAGWLGGWGGCVAILWVLSTALVGTGQQSSWKLQVFNTLYHLLLINIYLSQTVMKLIQYFFSFKNL